MLFLILFYSSYAGIVLSLCALHVIIQYSLIIQAFQSILHFCKKRIKLIFIGRKYHLPGIIYDRSLTLTAKRTNLRVFLRYCISASRCHQNLVMACKVIHCCLCSRLSFPVSVESIVLIFKNRTPGCIIITDSSFRIHIKLVYCFVIQCGNTIFPCTTAPFVRNIYSLTIKSLFTKICNNRLTIFHFPGKAFWPTSTCCLCTGFHDSLRRIQPVNKICQSLRILCFTSNHNSSISTVSVDLTSIRENTFICDWSKHEAFSLSFIGICIVRRLTEPWIWGKQDLSVLIFCKQSVIILSCRFRIYKSHLICLKQEFQRPYICRITVNKALIIRTVCFCKHETDLIISIKACFRLCI